MSDCHHRKLTLLPAEKNRFRCRRCHLTISAQELGESFCPECFERCGEKCYDFESLAESPNATARYRCETCGVIVPVGQRAAAGR